MNFPVGQFGVAGQGDLKLENFCSPIKSWSVHACKLGAFLTHLLIWPSQVPRSGASGRAFSKDSYNKKQCKKLNKFSETVWELGNYDISSFGFPPPFAQVGVWLGAFFQRGVVTLQVNALAARLSFSARYGKGNMKHLTIAWSLVCVCCVASIFLGLKLSAANKRIEQANQIMASSAASDKELRASVQASIDSQDKQAAQQDATSSVYGVYNCPDVQNYNQIDLRSDRTAAIYLQNQDGTEMLTHQNATWELDGSTVWIKKTSGAMQKYTIEQDDLIDQRGNRWIHTR